MGDRGVSFSKLIPSFSFALMCVGLPLAGILGGSNAAIAVVLGIGLTASGRFGGHFKEKVAPAYSVLFFFLIAYSAIVLYALPTREGFARLFQLLCCSVAMAVGSCLCKDAGALRLAKCMGAVAVSICLLSWIIEGCPMEDFSCFWGNPNTFALVALCWLVLFLAVPIGSKLDYVFSGICCLFVLISSSRSSLIAAVVLVGAFLLLNQKKTLSASTVVTMFLGAVILSLVFVLMYTFLYSTPFGNWLNDLSLEVFGKNFYSGRQVVWLETLRAIEDAPLLGHGLQAMPSDFYDTNLSAHNWYLEVALQSGLTGLSLMVLVLCAVLFAVADNVNNPNRALIVAFIFAMAFHEMFEVSLTQNAFMYGVVAWVLFGMGTASYDTNYDGDMLHE